MAGIERDAGQPARNSAAGNAAARAGLPAGPAEEKEAQLLFAQEADFTAEGAPPPRREPASPRAVRPRGAKRIRTIDPPAR